MTSGPGAEMDFISIGNVIKLWSFDHSRGQDSVNHPGPVFVGAGLAAMVRVRKCMQNLKNRLQASSHRGGFRAGAFGTEGDARCPHPGPPPKGEGENRGQTCALLPPPFGGRAGEGARVRKQWCCACPHPGPPQRGREQVGDGLGMAYTWPSAISACKSAKVLASCRGLSVRRRVMRGKRRATPLLWRRLS